LGPAESVAASGFADPAFAAGVAGASAFLVTTFPSGDFRTGVARDIGASARTGAGVGPAGVGPAGVDCAVAAGLGAFLLSDSSTFTVGAAALAGATGSATALLAGSSPFAANSGVAELAAGS